MAENINPNAAMFKAPAEVLGIDPGARRALIVLETGEPFAKAGRWLRYQMTADACDLSVLNSGRAPLLDSHGYTVSDILGVIECAWLEANEHGRTVAKCIARFSRNKSGKAAWKDVHDGILNYSSVGAETIAAEQEGDVLTVRRWKPFEVTLCPLPSNRTCGASVAQDIKSDDLASMVIRHRAEQTVLREVFERKKLKAAEWLDWAERTAPSLAIAVGADVSTTARALGAAVTEHLKHLGYAPEGAAPPAQPIIAPIGT